MSTTAAIPAAAPAIITAEHVRQFHEQGFFVLERAIPAAHLELLRRHCASAVADDDAEMDRRGVDSLGITHRGSRYFCGHPSLKRPELYEFIFSPLMADVCRATLGPEACVFWEQYVVKMGECGMKFAWHQDSGYVGYPHTPYLTCWCALDDVTEENGTVHVLPYDRAGGKALCEHTAEPGTNDLVGYRGEDPGVPIVAPAGSIAVFSSLTFHRSGANTTPGTRRIYLIQYSGQPIKGPQGKLAGRDERFLADGRIVGKSPA